MATSQLRKKLTAQRITLENFQAYGQVIYATGDGTDDATDAQLELGNGTPHFYIMRLRDRGRKFNKITRHIKCTQCLGSLGGKTWLIAVAPPSPAPQPNLDEIQAFQISGDCFIKLNVGTWHAGPYFDGQFVDFYNLELSDTNINDHQTYDLLAHGLEIEIV